MSVSKKLAIPMVLLMIAAMLLGACGPAPEPEVIVETVVVEQTKIVEVAGEETTIIETVEVEVEREVTAVPPPPEAAPARDTLVVCMSQEPDTLYLVTSNMAVQRNVYNAYMDMGSASDTAYWFYTDLLEKLPALEDGDAVLTGEEGPEGQLAMTFKVKDGITWHDGEPLKASDFKYAYDVMMDPESGVVSRSTWEKIETFEVVDDLTFVVTLKVGIMDPMYGTYYVPEPLPQHVLGEMAPVDIVDSEYSRTGYPGVGPFVFEEWVAGDSITFTKNENYYKDGPVFGKVVYRFIPDTNSLMAALIAGECDVATNDGLQVTNLPFMQQAKAKGLVDYHAQAGTVWEHFDINQWPWDDRLPWFAETAVRQAVAFGTNRLQMTEEILYGETDPMQSWIPSDSWAFNPDVAQYPYDPEKAKELLASAGFEDKDGDGVLEAYGYSGTFPDQEGGGRAGDWTIPDGTPFEVSFNTTTGNAMREALSQIFQSNMADIGINVTLDLLPASVYFADDGPLSQRRFDICEYAWVSDPDPGGDTLWVGMDILGDDGSVLIAEQIPSEGDDWEGQNYDGWVNAEASKLSFDAKNALSQSDRTPFYHAQQVIFMEEVPTIPLFQRVEVTGFSPDLRGWVMGPSSYVTWNMNEWYFEE
ncbi:peptide ABC transporter substrate-binding protein [Chloroflexota bacterium]